MCLKDRVNQPGPPSMSALLAKLELKVPPLALLLATALAMWQAAVLWPGSFRWSGGAAPWVATGVVLCVGAGLGLCLAAVWQFRQQRTTVDPTRPHATQQLVIGGVYRVTRNPMYLAFALLLLAWALVLGSAPAGLGLPLFVLYLNRFQIVPEERALRARFGAAYAQYLSRVRRWL